MIPTNLIESYWEDVEDLLRTRHECSRERARTGINEYRRLLDSRGVGEMIYHRDPPETAEAIAEGIASGFRTVSG